MTSEDAIYRDLIERSYVALKHAYAPYSNYLVGATLLCDDGSIISGCNIESTTIGITICAERCAIAKAVSEGTRKFKAVAVVTAKSFHCWPCGPCRQLLSEFSPGMDVVVEDESKNLIVHKLSELLPSLV